MLNGKKHYFVNLTFDVQLITPIKILRLSSRVQNAASVHISHIFNVVIYSNKKVPITKREVKGKGEPLWFRKIRDGKTSYKEQKHNVQEVRKYRKRFGMYAGSGVSVEFLPKTSNIVCSSSRPIDLTEQLVLLLNPLSHPNN